MYHPTNNPGRHGHQQQPIVIADNNDDDIDLDDDYENEGDYYDYYGNFDP